MERTMKEALMHRRSYYSITDSSPVTDEAIENIVKFAAEYIPSAFNSQSARLVLLLGDNHKKLWDIVKSVLKVQITPEAFMKTEAKIEASFASGYGTVLFFEDMETVENLQKNFPLYADKFPSWSDQTSAMHQLTVWTLLEDAGFGASLQHYNPLIDQPVRDEWNLPRSWRLVSQMPFGMPLEQPGQKTNLPLDQKVKVFK